MRINRKKIALPLLLIWICISGYPQIGINTDDPDPSAVLDINSNNKGVLVPKLASTSAITNPANGLIVYDSIRNNLCVFDSVTGWQELRPFPKGGIIMWSGLIKDIPFGWALCNGNNGTPDLSGQFIVSYDNNTTDYNAIGKSGGENTTYLEEGQLPSHTHVISPSDGAHTHTVKQSGSHTHTTEQELDSDGNTGHFHFVARNKSGSSGLSASNCIAYHTNEGSLEQYKFKSTTSSNPDIGVTNRGGHTHEVTDVGSTHTHEINNGGAHTHTIQPVGNNDAIENRPAFYVLAFIIKL